MKRGSATDRRVRRAPALVLLLAIASLVSCADDADIVRPGPGELFDRYVALGNSITAAFQSGGLHFETQNQAYPVLLAAKAGASFGVPAMAHPGCPPPVAGPLTTERIGGGLCAGRVQPLPSLVQNLAVPGATVAHATQQAGTGSGLDLLILGARSQITAMRSAQPTLVSVWLGNNDALGAALNGDPALLTPIAEFQAAYDAVVDAILETPAGDAILIGVADAARMAPALQPGAYFWALAQQPDLPLTLEVTESCAPFSEAGQPNPAAFERLVSFQAVANHLVSGADQPLVIDCSADAAFVLTQGEQQAIANRVAEFNAHIQDRAEAHGWIYVDPGPSLVQPALADPDAIRKCQLLTPTNEAAFLDAVHASCPGMDAPNFFGFLFSFDGVHPSSAGHAIIADTLAARLNAKHGLALPTGT